MERALLQGEREAERALLQKEQKAVDQLQEKLVTLETGIQKEKDKVTNTWSGSVLGTRVLGETKKCFLWGLTPYLIILPADWVVSVPLRGRGLVLCGWSSLEGTAGWAGVWGFCAVSGCLGTCHYGPFMALPGSTKAISWAVSTA